MRIDIYEPENMLYVKSLSEEELFNECGRDEEMFNDFIRYIKAHPYAKPLHQYWIYIEDDEILTV